jgi:hypothetical protein
MKENATFRPIAVGDRWQVEVEWPNGDTQRLSGYASQEEARSWIGHYSKRWLAVAAQEFTDSKRLRAIVGT